MLKTILGWLAIAMVATSYLQGAGQQSPVAQPPSSTYRATLDRYCVTCHNDRLKTAGLMLDKTDVERVSEGAAVWEKVIRKLRTGAMPPVGMPRPERGFYESFPTYLEAALDRAAEANPNPGRLAIHRLNRSEYSNAIRDLLAVEVDAASLLPADDSGDFDNVADILSVSPLLLERYISAARKISRLAIGDSAVRAGFDTYNVTQALMQEDRMSEDLPFGSRGGVAIRHHFPLDGEYVIRIRLQREADEDHIRGLGEPHQLDVRLDGARIKLFTIGGDQNQGKSGSITSNPEPAQHEYELKADAGLEVRFPAKAGTRLVGVAFLNEFSELEGIEGMLRSRREGFVAYERKSWYSEGNPAVATVMIGGPYEAKGPGETASRRRIFVCHPADTTQEEPCAKRIVSTLARKAYRRPVRDEDIQALLSFYKTGRSKQGFEAGIETALRRILVDPEFLFRVERDPVNAAPDTAYRINDLELASRLSFFLWSSVPDEELLDLAASGKLKDPGVLDRQVRRMLGDARSKALVDNFAGQWLYVRNMRLVTPDPDLLPDFDENLREAFEQETSLFFESIMREDRSVLDLLKADYTFVNERLARHYGIPNVYGSHFRRVTLPDEGRRGLLGQGSILTVTSYANRTSPVLRGKWLLDNILGAPPPPPPPDVVPGLKNKDDAGRVLSIRQQMEQHRANPACAVCHSRMDPLGFALENFDAIGKWRTSEADAPIDTSGVLLDGTKFQGPGELRKVLLSKPEQFVTTFTEKLLTYALGRAVQSFDEPAVRRIVRESAATDYRWSALVLALVKSTPFQMRRAGKP